MKKTAVQWLIDELEKYEVYAKISYRCLGEIEIALDMEKEQIEESYKDGWNAGDYGSDCWEEIYYKENYKRD